MVVHLLQALRIANVPLVTAATLVVAIRINDFVMDITIGRRLIYTGAVVIFSGVAIGSAIKYILHRPVDVSIALVTIGSILILAGAWLTRHDEPGPRADSS